MNQVDPIKYKEEIHQMYQVLQERSQRDYLFFKFAIHTGIKPVSYTHLTLPTIYSV